MINIWKKEIQKQEAQGLDHLIDLLLDEINIASWMTPAQK